MITQAEFEIIQKKYQDLLISIDRGEIKREKLLIEQESQDPEFWVNPANTARLKKLARLEKEEEEVANLESSLADLNAAFELEDGEAFSFLYKKVSELGEKIEQKLFFTGDFDDKDAVVMINAGAGGVDAMDFAAMIMSMYQSLCKNMEWKYTIASLSAGEAGGVKSATLIINGDFAYGFMKEEAGVHRLIRLSPFNSGNTRETSFVAVEVLPDGLDQVADIKIDEKDIRVDTFMSGGNGGQSVNTTYSAVRVTHIPTGITAVCQNERDQIQNKETALKILKSRLAHKQLIEQKELLNSLKGVSGSAEFGSQIRTYTMHPYKLVKDHRSGFESGDVESVLDGKTLIDFIWAQKRKKASAS